MEKEIESEKRVKQRIEKQRIEKQRIEKQRSQKKKSQKEKGEKKRDQKKRSVKQRSVTQKRKAEDAKRTYLKGSLTVEAASVVSMTFLVLGALLIAVLFLHDRAVFQSLICETAVTGSNFSTDEERSQAAEGVRQEIKNGRFMGSRNISAVRGIGEKEASASGSAQYPVPGMFMRVLNGGTLRIDCSWSSDILEAAGVIRKIRGAELVVGKLLEKNG